MANNKTTFIPFIFYSDTVGLPSKIRISIIKVGAFALGGPFGLKIFDGLSDTRII